MLIQWRAVKQRMPLRLQQFLSWPGTDRVHTWAGDVNMVGVGLALAALAWGYAPAANPSPWDTALFWLFLATAGLFLIAGILAKTPTATVDERWDDRYDTLRDLTDEVMPVLSSSYIGSVWSQTLEDGEKRRESWQEYIPDVPIPLPDERPLDEWRYFIEHHESQDVRHFFRFACSASSLIQVGNYRRFAVRTYHRFGRLVRAGADGFDAWMADEGVRNGARPLVVLLAYLEIARACSHPTDYPGDGHSGFWFLAQQWHPHTMRLPRPTPAAPVSNVSA